MPSIALLKKELLLELRRVRLFMWLLFLAVLMIWWVGAGWPRGDYQLAWANVGQYSNNVFIGVSSLLFGGCVLFVPGIAATSIVQEKERGSWDPLFVTLISPMGIFGGKLLSAIGLYLLFIVATFPIVSAIFFLIGVDWTQFLFAFGMILATTVTCGVIGVACSARFRSTLWAVFFSYLGTAILMGLPLLVLMIIQEIDIVPLLGRVNFFTFRNNWLLVFMSAHLTFAAAHGNYGGILLGYFQGNSVLFLTMGHLMYQAILAITAFVWGARAIWRPADPAVERGGAPIDNKARLRTRRRRFPFYLLDPQQRPKPIRDGKNPVCEKELRWGFLRRRSLATRLFIVYFLFSVAVSTFSAVAYIDRFTGWVVVLSLLQGAALCAFIPLFLSHMYPREHERENLDMLRMSLLSGQDVVKGKYGAGLRMAGTLMVLTIIADLPILLVAIIKGDGPLTWMFISGVVSLAVCVLLTLGVTARVSVMVRSTGPAIVASFMGSVFVLFGAWFFGFLLAETLDFNLREDEGFGLFLIYASPVTAYIFETLYWNNEWRHVYWALSMISLSFVAFGLRWSACRYYGRKRWQDR